MTESLASIEDQLQRAFSKQHLFDAMIKTLDVSSPKDRDSLKSAVEMAIKSRDQSALKVRIKKVAGAVTDKGVDIILAKLLLE